MPSDVVKKKVALASSEEVHDNSNTSLQETIANPIELAKSYSLQVHKHSLSNGRKREKESGADENNPVAQILIWTDLDLVAPSL